MRQCLPALPRRKRPFGTLNGTICLSPLPKSLRHCLGGVAKSFLFPLFARPRALIPSARSPPSPRKLHHMRKYKFIRSIIDIYACRNVGARERERVYTLFLDTWGIRHGSRGISRLGVFFFFSFFLTGVFIPGFPLAGICRLATS